MDNIVYIEIMKTKIVRFLLSIVNMNAVPADGTDEVNATAKVIGGEMLKLLFEQINNGTKALGHGLVNAVENCGLAPDSVRAVHARVAHALAAGGNQIGAIMDAILEMAADEGFGVFGPLIPLDDPDYPMAEAVSNDLIVVMRLLQSNWSRELVTAVVEELLSIRNNPMYGIDRDNLGMAFDAQGNEVDFDIVAVQDCIEGWMIYTIQSGHIAGDVVSTPKELGDACPCEDAAEGELYGENLASHQRAVNDCLDNYLYGDVEHSSSKAVTFCANEASAPMLLDMMADAFEIMGETPLRVATMCLLNDIRDAMGRDGEE